MFADVAPRLVVQRDSVSEYSLVGDVPSPFPQHKGHPLEFGSVVEGQASVSVHLMPLYMDATLTALVTPALEKRMTGKSCFHFEEMPEAEMVAELKTLIGAAYEKWNQKGWI